jgi:DNA-binding response OmpR family regulator
VEAARTLADASRQLRDHPPEALIVNVRPASAPWEKLRDLCERHDPPIPVLYESCIFHDPAEAGLGELSSCGHFLEKPYTIAELRCEVEWLVREAENHRDQPHEEDQGAGDTFH